MTRLLRAGGVLLAVVVLLVACGDAGDAPGQGTTGAAGSPPPRMAKPGKLAQGPALLKTVDAAGVARPAAVSADSRELTAVVGALRSVLGARPGTYQATVATVLDNATLAAQNANPNYGQLLATWGRLTGTMAVFEQKSGGQPGLLRVSVILSHYRAPEGAHAAYQYVVQQQSQAARRLDLPADGGGAPWDEAIVFYQEVKANDQTLGQYTFIFRASGLIGFVTNVGLAGAVTPRDTADFAQAVIQRLSGS